MRYIPTDGADGNITASTANASFPVTNLSDYNPKSVWKATSTNATLTVTHSAVGRYDWALFNCSDLENVAWELFNGAVSQGSGFMEEDGLGNHWLDEQAVGTTTHIVFTLSSVANVSCGILRGGYQGGFELSDHNDPTSLTKSFADYSLIDKTRNQALNIRQKDRVWMYSGSVQSPIDTVNASNGTAVFLSDAKTAAPYPIAVKVVETLYADFVFGLVNVTSSGNVIFDAGVPFLACNFDITEVL